MNLPATSNGSTSGSIVAAASCICASAFAVSVSEAGSGTSYRRAISVISWSTGPSWISFSETPRLRAISAPSSSWNASTSRSVRLIAPVSISVTSVRNPTSCCQNAISSSIMCSRRSGPTSPIIPRSRK